MRNKKPPAMRVEQLKSLTIVSPFRYNEVVQAIIKRKER